MTDRIRLTVSITPETHEVFSRIAESASMSLGRAIGDWLADTHEGALFVAGKMEEARKSPSTVMRSFQALALGLHDEATRDLNSIREAAFAQGRVPGGTGRSPAPPGARGRAIPPSGNTGGKSPVGSARKSKSGGRK